MRIPADESERTKAEVIFGSALRSLHKRCLHTQAESLSSTACEHARGSVSNGAIAALPVAEKCYPSSELSAYLYTNRHHMSENIPSQQPQPLERFDPAAYFKETVAREIVGLREQDVQKGAEPFSPGAIDFAVGRMSKEIVVETGRELSELSQKEIDEWVQHRGADLILAHTLARASMAEQGSTHAVVDKDFNVRGTAGSEDAARGMLRKETSEGN